MAEYRTLKMSLWSDPFIEELSAHGKLLYLYLITSPHTNNLGILEISRKRISNETGMSVEEIELELDEMKKNGKLVEVDGFLWLVNFISNQTGCSPKIIESLKRISSTIKSKRLQWLIWERYPYAMKKKPEHEEEPNTPTDDTDTLSIPYVYPIDTLSDVADTLCIPSPELEVELEVEVESELEVEYEMEEEVEREGEYKGEGKPPHVSACGENAPDVPIPRAKTQKIPYGEIQSLWNSVIAAKGRPAISALTKTRQDKIKRLWKQAPEADFRDVITWRRFFEHMARSDFLMTGKFFCFDWMLKPENWQKIIEGNYHTPPGGRKKPWENR